MARALKRVSVARGLDPRRMALLPFGGAGPLFGCRLADALGMRTIVIPPHPGALSALGLAAAAERVDLLASLHRPLDDLQATEIGRAFSPLLTEGARQVPGGALWRYADCRFAGQGYEVTVPVTADEPQTIKAAFVAAHRDRYGHSGVGQPVEVVNLRVVALREGRSEEHTSELQSRLHLVCRLLLEKKKKTLTRVSMQLPNSADHM